MNFYFFTVVVSLFLLTIVTRSFPFLFAEKLEGNLKMKALGRRLTSHIMVLLVIYEVNPASFEKYPFGLPALVSLGVVLLAHLFLRKPLLSMILGTTSFVLLNMHYT